MFSAKHSFSKAKTVCWKKQKIYEKLCFFEHGKMVIFGFGFLGFNVIVVCFWCVWHSSKSVKNACFFSQFFGLLWGGLFLFILGLEGLGVFAFLVFVFVFLCCFCFCFVCFVLFCCWIVFGVGSCFDFIFVCFVSFFSFVFFVLVSLFLFFLFLLFCFFWRV